MENSIVLHLYMKMTPYITFRFWNIIHDHIKIVFSKPWFARVIFRTFWDNRLGTIVYISELKVHISWIHDIPLRIARNETIRMIYNILSTDKNFKRYFASNMGENKYIICMFISFTARLSQFKYFNICGQHDSAILGSWIRVLIRIIYLWVHLMMHKREREDITRWREQMDFILEWWKQYFLNERSEWAKYCFHHEKIKFKSSNHHVIFVLLYRFSAKRLRLQLDYTSSKFLWG